MIENLFFEDKLKESGLVLEETTSETSAIPNWFKSNAKWWKQGLISDSDIINALENLIIQDVIPLDNFVKESSGLEHTAGVSPGGTFVMVDEKPAIPSFQKDVFGFWSDGIVSDAEIVNSIGFLMTEGIINSAKIQTEISERQSKFDQKMKELDESLASDKKFMENLDKDAYDTVKNADGSKTMTFEDGSTTTFFEDGSRTTTFTDNPESGPEFIMDFYDKLLNGGFGGGTIYSDRFDAGIHHASDGSKKYFIIDHEKGTTNWVSESMLDRYWDKKSGSIYYDKNGNETYDPTSYVVELSLYDFLTEEILSNDTGGEMEQLTQVSAMIIDSIYYPISQFTIWKWTGECDDAWHYHTSFGQAISADGVTGIVDPDQDNCGFGKVGEVFIGTVFMTQDEINKFREKTGTDPLSNEAMHGGSDDGASPVDSNPGPVSIDDSDLPLTTLDSSDLDVSDFTDSDGDGIEDEIDPNPNKASKEFSTGDGGVSGKIIGDGGNDIKIIDGGDGSVIIEVGSSTSEPAIVEILGVELELEPGTIVEADFG